MAFYCNVYKDNPTPGGTDGTLITATNPLSFTLDARINEVSAPTLLAIRCDPGHSATLVELHLQSGTGSNPNRWYIAADQSGTPGVWVQGSQTSKLTIGTVGTTNIPFWIKAEARNVDPAGFDRTVNLGIFGTIT